METPFWFLVTLKKCMFSLLIKVGSYRGNFKWAKKQLTYICKVKGCCHLISNKIYDQRDCWLLTHLHFTKNIKRLIFPVILLAWGGHRVVLRAPGDHITLRNEHNIEKLGASYFLESMEIFRQKFKRVVFVYVSDDLEWGREKLERRIKSKDFFIAGSLQDPNLKGKNADNYISKWSVWKVRVYAWSQLSNNSERPERKDEDEVLFRQTCAK